MGNKEFYLTHRIVEIKLLNFVLSVIDEKDKPKINVNAVVFELNVKSENLNTNGSIIKLIFKIKFFADPKKTIFLGEMDTQGTFEILNFDELLEISKDIPISVLTLFTGILVSTSRGFYVLKVAGTYLDGSIYPAIDAAQFYKTLIEKENKELKPKKST